MTDPNTEELAQALEKAMRCLYVETPREVAKDIEQRGLAVIARLRELGAERDELQRRLDKELQR